MAERKLRSKDERKTPNAALFNFENINRLLYRDQTIPIITKKVNDNLYRYTGTTTHPHTTNKTRDVVIREILVPRKSKGKEDILNDQVYETFHRRMKKEERKMGSSDRLRILSEVDTLQTSLSLLGQYDWVRHLPGITQIRDPHNYQELEYKRVLTMYEIRRLLRKYESWKKRDDELLADVRDFHSGREAPGPGTPREEFYVPLDELKRERNAQRRKKYGSTITLKLNNGLALVIDPILPPKFIKVAMSGSTNSSKRGSVEPLASDLQTVDTDHSETDINNTVTTEESTIAFGAKVPELKQHIFTIPSYWRSQSNAWKHARTELRADIEAQKESLNK
ncbi:hypothetical protein CAAN1_06S03862 [[Candida] anglica]|uniref:Something about silencing protein 4 domain-containing protein n=1 Tax=[Candida] anglica TaxID=148631 RepID=A0ABP0EL99_9ASCO